MFDALNQDLTFRIRAWRRNPFFAAVAILSLAVSIAATSTVFTIANALLLRPLPGLHEPGRPADVGQLEDGRGFDTGSCSERA